MQPASRQVHAGKSMENPFMPTYWRTCVGVLDTTKFLAMLRQSPLPNLASPCRNSRCSSSVHGTPFRRSAGFPLEAWSSDFWRFALGEPCRGWRCRWLKEERPSSRPRPRSPLAGMPLGRHFAAAPCARCPLLAGSRPALASWRSLGWESARPLCAVDPPGRGIGGAKTLSSAKRAGKVRGSASPLTAASSPGPLEECGQARRRPPWPICSNTRESNSGPPPLEASTSAGAAQRAIAHRSSSWKCAARASSKSLISSGLQTKRSIHASWRCWKP